MALTQLERLRAEISRIDEELLKLLTARLVCAGQIGAYKREHEMPIEDPQYEMLKRREREELLGKEKENREGIEAIFGSIMKVARHVQRKTAMGGDAASATEKGTATGLRVAVMGSTGSFSEEAALHYLKKAGVKDFTLSYPISAEGVLSALDEKNADIGIFPIHNSTGGLVIESIYAASEHHFSIEELFEIDIRQCLLGLPGAKVSQIMRITSHPQALAQCKGYLHQHFSHAELVEANDTATAAAMLGAHRDMLTTAVIAPKRCAQMYNLEILAEAIQDQKINLTQFIVARL